MTVIGLDSCQSWTCEETKLFEQGETPQLNQ